MSRISQMTLEERKVVLKFLEMYGELEPYVAETENYARELQEAIAFWQSTIETSG